MKGPSLNPMDIDVTLDTHQSVYREHLLEHLLIGDLLKFSWLQAGAKLEVSQPSIDRSGHDVVLEANGVTRHVQLKSSSHAATTTSQKVHLGLASKPSGCVVWTRFDRATMNLGPFLFFGAEPGLPLPPLNAFKMAKHTKGDKEGVKKERPNLRIVRMSQFREIADIPALYMALFGTGVIGGSVALLIKRRKLAENGAAPLTLDGPLLPSQKIGRRTTSPRRRRSRTDLCGSCESAQFQPAPNWRTGTI